MFVLKEKFEFTHDVAINMPTDNGFEKHKMKVTFLFKEQDNIDELLRAGDKDLLRDVIVGWPDFKDEEGNDVPFTSETLEMMLRRGYMRTALINAYFRAINGLPEKN